MIDFRSDTVTKPTATMRKAAYEAEVGDDVYKEDPSVNKLEEIAAEMLGKEGALFVTSGTQGNQIAALTHCKPGDEVIMEANAHVYVYEAGAFSALAGVQPRPIPGVRGAMDPFEVASAIRADDIHFPETSLICLENTHNKAGGAVIPIDNMKAIYEIANSNRIPVHLDGARLFNAAVASGKSVKDFASYADTVQFCLSKGLGAPVGSIIAGPSEFIQKARKWRKRLGGGLRQSGMIAAPGLVALQNNVDRLVEDHDNAKILANGLGNINGITIVNEVETNIVIVDVSGTGYNAEQFVEELRKKEILVGGYSSETVRFVTHYDVNVTQVKQAIEKIDNLIN
ncbi:low-specificity L-threonine aldolase [Aquibacillus kalidii]|uniref:low-specificity L-threonine aldolase n=1 Tax=Aquibacillus kalidii TaxID=2762597 RepID=UPI001645B07E|nr:low-specificity L-threonine aldolase [Aquibacillus kalidii]